MEDSGILWLRRRQGEMLRDGVVLRKEEGQKKGGTGGSGYSCFGNILTMMPSKPDPQPTVANGKI